MKRSIRLFLALCICMALVAPNAHAALELTIELDSVVIVNDNGVGDLNLALGIIEYSSDVNNIQLAITATGDTTAGASTPLLLDVNYINNFGATFGASFGLKDNSNFNSLGDLTGTISGTLTPSTPAFSVAGAVNGVSQFIVISPTGAFSESIDFADPLTVPYSLSQLVNVSLPNGGSTQFIYTMNVAAQGVSEPSILLLVSVGLGALSFFMRRKCA